MTHRQAVALGFLKTIAANARVRSGPYPFKASVFIARAAYLRLCDMAEGTR